MRKSIIFNSWTRIVLRITEVIFGLILGFWLGSKFIHYQSSLVFCAAIFVLIITYFYYLFFEWLIKWFTTWSLTEAQFSQILQASKFNEGGKLLSRPN